VGGDQRKADRRPEPGEAPPRGLGDALVEEVEGERQERADEELAVVPGAHQRDDLAAHQVGGPAGERRAPVHPEGAEEEEHEHPGEHEVDHEPQRHAGVGREQHPEQEGRIEGVAVAGVGQERHPAEGVRAPLEDPAGGVEVLGGEGATGEAGARVAHGVDEELPAEERQEGERHDQAVEPGGGEDRESLGQS